VESADRHPEGAEVLGRRIGAGFIDIAVLFFAFLAVALATNNVHTDNGVYANLKGLGLLIWLALVFAYYWLFETVSGQTPGKQLLSIRVVDGDGTPPGAGRAAGRTVLRIIDVLPFFYLLGFIVVLATRKRSGRIGDLAAKTYVVHT
jgi:uncharacterized RDD family membrane protein YckC